MPAVRRQSAPRSADGPIASASWERRTSGRHAGRCDHAPASGLVVDRLHHRPCGGPASRSPDPTAFQCWLANRPRIPAGSTARYRRSGRRGCFKAAGHRLQHARPEAVRVLLDPLRTRGRNPTGALPPATTRPSAPIKAAFELVVPWSIAKINSSIDAPDTGQLLTTSIGAFFSRFRPDLTTSAE